MTGISIDKYGKIYGSYDNGDSNLLGQVVVATFPNAAGLEAVGNNMFATTQNSGSFDGIGKDILTTGGCYRDVECGSCERVYRYDYYAERFPGELAYYHYFGYFA